MPEKVVISTKSGKVQGIKQQSLTTEAEFYTFYAIPYAQPPTGDLRFKDPVPIQPWKGVKDATIEKDGCVQFSLAHFRRLGSEDCLYINVHTPSLPSPNESPRSVIVFIHPGGLIWGSPDSTHHGSPNYVMDHDVVYVTIGYRLNIFGFLNLKMPECSGNQGIKDIILALKWVKENIRTFNGDPYNVTLLGGSSGAALVHLLLMLPAAKGLFHKAIIMGNYVFNCLLPNRFDQAKLAFDFAREIGFRGDDAKKLLKFLKSKPAMMIVNKQKDFRHRVGENLVAACFGGIFMVGSDYGENAILPASPREFIKLTERVPVIFGVCEREAVNAFTRMAIAPVQTHFKESFRQSCWGWMYYLDDDELDQVYKQIESYYFERSKYCSPIFIKENILTDVELSEVYDTVINLISAELPSSVYVYKFQYDSEIGMLKNLLRDILVEKFEGTYHSDDMNYWAQTCPPLKEQTRKLITTFTTLLTTFAKTGNPNSDKMDVQWKPTTPEAPCYLSIKEKLSMVDGKLNGDKSEFWDNLMKRYKHD